jgi:hypothetical protein
VSAAERYVVGINQPAVVPPLQGVKLEKARHVNQEQFIFEAVEQRITRVRYCPTGTLFSFAIAARRLGHAFAHSRLAAAAGNAPNPIDANLGNVAAHLSSARLARAASLIDPRRYIPPDFSADHAARANMPTGLH